LLTPILHKRYVGEPVEFCEPRIDIGRHGFDQDAATHAAYTDALAWHPEGERQAHGLAAAMHENLRDGAFGHGVLPFDLHQ
jgi:hypothetical protein